MHIGQLPYAGDQLPKRCVAPPPGPGWVAPDDPAREPGALGRPGASSTADACRRGWGCGERAEAARGGKPSCRPAGTSQATSTTGPSSMPADVQSLVMTPTSPVPVDNATRSSKGSTGWARADPPPPPAGGRWVLRLHADGNIGAVEIGPNGSARRRCLGPFL